MSTSAFNSYAADYDTHFTNSPIGILQRKRVFKFLLPLLDKQKDVLEINCGTGVDALSIAPLANSVLATDISNEMIREALLKKERAGFKNLHFKTENIKGLHKSLSSPFHLLFSDFGGLNCLSPKELEDFSKNIHPFISTGGKLVLVVMGKKCLWENFFFLKQKDARYGRRNTSSGIETQINGSNFLTYYYSPNEMTAFFSEHFYCTQVRPIGLFIPPSYLNSYFSKKKWLLKLLNVLEKICGNFSFTSNYSDHYLLVLEKIN